MADNYDNPKTIKMYGVQRVEQTGKKEFKAVTYLRTAMIGFRVIIDASDIEGLSKKCKAHNHSRGLMLEIGRLG